MLKSSLCAPSQATGMHKSIFPACQSNLQIQKSPERVSWDQRALGPWLSEATLATTPFPQQCPLHHDRKGKQETPKAGPSIGQRDFLLLCLALNFLSAIKGD